MNADEVVSKLNAIFPNPKCELEFNSNYELLVAVILSAQCTDKRVNIVTKELFKNYNTPYKMITLSLEELENKIHSCGFYHNKAKNILAMSNDLIERFGGKVPCNKEDLQTLAGVGRKTANVVYSEGFNGDAIAVDTHVLRVSNRLGLAKTDNPHLCENKLMNIFDKKDWSRLHLQFVLFGRYICKSQNPQCKECPFTKMCIYYKEMHHTI